jgi:hypothetical protein
MAQGGHTPKRSWLAAALCLLAGLSAAAVAQDSGYAPGRYEGVASCAGSTCHGRSEGNGEVVRQDEIATWQEPSSVTGAHSRAYAVLDSLRGRQILASLEPEVSRAQCLGCHRTYFPGEPRGARFQETDGVGCESCHGPAGGWIDSHRTTLGSHDANVRNGMTRLDDPQVRARTCLNCHFGSDDGNQFVTHSMMAAGHPRVSFELDLFSALQQHHVEDLDYYGTGLDQRGKQRTNSVQMWAVGQAEAVRRSAELFANDDFGTMGIFPELYFYDCHSCHRQITDGPQRRLTFDTNPGRDIPFGQPPFNDENQIMLAAVARVLAPGEAQAFETAGSNFHRAMRNGRPEAKAAAMRLRDAALNLSNALARRRDGDAFEVIAAIADRTTNSRFTDYSGSAQAVMAVDTLLNALVREERITVGAAAGIRADINRAYDAVRTPEGYNPVRFRAALGQAAGAIGRLQ